MAPLRKTKGVNKRFPYINEVASNKYGDNVNKNRQKKRKLCDMLGPQWTTEELKHFYEAYRKYGRDWKKVASVVRHRSVENVEALYTMNRAYLSLPEGTASVIGLTAMMCDYYSMLERSESEHESIDGAGTSRKPRKLARGKLRSDASKGLEGHIPDISQARSIASDGCLSLLKNRRTGIRPHAVKKRTPRVPVASYDKDNSRKYFSPGRKGIKISTDADDGNVAHEIAFSLTEPSQRGGSPHVSRTPKKKAKGNTPSPVQNGERMFAETEMTIARPCGGEMDEGGCELSLGRMQADHERYYLKKQKREESENNHFENVEESSSGTEEEQYKLGTVKGKLGTKVVGAKNASSFHKDKKKTKKANVGRDEGSSFDALLTLADLSLRMPEETAEMESSAHVEEENFNIANKSKLKGNRSITMVEDTALKTSQLGKLKEGVQQSNIGIQKRKQKLPFKLQIHENEAQADFHWSDNQMIELVQATDEVNHLNKSKRSSHYNVHQKQGKLVKPLGNTSSTTDSERRENNSGLSTVEVQYSNQASLPLRDRSKRKVDIQKDTKDQPSKLVLSFHKNELNLKGLSNCLSRYQARRWCAFEWFYSAIDYPWFAKREFVEYLNHVGLGHVPRLTRVEWGVIRSSLGRPRRFSDQFLKEEKEKLNQYRESVRTHYAELNAGTREGLPTDLARPLSVGQHVIAFHPRTREIHNGIVLSADHSRYHVQFDQPELGVADIMDIDCMPLNPLENLPASFIKQNIIVSKYTENFKGLKINELKESKIEGYMNVVSTNNLNSTIVPCHIPPLTPHTNKSKHIEGNSSRFNVESKVGHGETARTLVADSRPAIPAQIQAKEADVRALFQLTRALDKKDAVVSELRCMNDEVFGKCQDGDNSIKDSEPFKKEYAAVLLQLSEINDQVSSALFCLRQRNTYRGSYPLISVNPMAGLIDSGGHSSSSCHIQEPASHVYEIVESSRAKARKMVEVAMQAISSLKRENNIERIQEVIDFVSKRLSEDDVGSLLLGSSTPAALILESEDQSTACTAKPLAVSCGPDPKSNILPNQGEDQLLSDLIANCVAVLLMIQTCTARQFSPADVARVLDHAVTILKPICTQNLPVYGEIQKCMGIIRSQILALVPT